jgi:hypothetical protein
MKKFLIISLVLGTLILSCIKFPNIGVGYKLEYNAMGDIGIVNSVNSYLIYGHILEFAYDSNFIILSERPRDSVPECLYLNGENARDCDLAFNRSLFRQYYIIDKRKESYFIETTKSYSNVYGPFKKEKYLEMVNSLKVSNKLALKDY